MIIGLLLIHGFMNSSTFLKKNPNLSSFFKGLKLFPYLLNSNNSSRGWWKRNYISHNALLSCYLAEDQHVHLFVDDFLIVSLFIFEIWCVTFSNTTDKSGLATRSLFSLTERWPLMTFSGGRARVMQIKIAELIWLDPITVTAAWHQVTTSRTSSQTTHTTWRQRLIRPATERKMFSSVDQHLDFSSSRSGFSARPALESDLIPSWVHKAGAAWLSTMPCGLRGCCGFSMSARRRRRRRKNLTSEPNGNLREREKKIHKSRDGGWKCGEKNRSETLWLWELWKQGRPCPRKATSGLGVAALDLFLLHLEPSYER